MHLTRENYRHGFLVDDEAIGGVAELEAGGGASVYSAYVSHYLTGETLLYREFDALDDALSFLGTVERKWVYEAVGCSTKTKSAGCGSGGCGTSGICG